MTRLDSAQREGRRLARCLARYLARCLAFAGTSLLPSFVVAACLSPVPSYQKTDLETSAADLRRVAIEPIAERRGQLLRAFLEERFATGERKLSKTHVLSVSLAIHKSERDFGRLRVVGEMRAVAEFTLKEKQTKERRVLLRGRVTERINYTVSSEFLARRDAEDEALRHALTLVADEMLLRLRLYFFTRAEKEREEEREGGEGAARP